ncbi:MAG: hypothetical protein M1832_005338 [Thelocarpon impressellum]|nr:MAG: hypothetical protein M1832_005338 [Thelocarpon impressellum]
MAEDDGDSGDRLLAEYDIYLTDALAERLMLLQYPNRDRAQPYTDANHARPSELRIKPGAGLVEIDIPMDVQDNFDPEKAIRWGEAVRRSVVERAGGSQGLAGGFGVGASSAGSSGAGRGAGEAGEAGEAGGAGEAGEGGEVDAIQERLLANLVKANAEGRVFNKLTLGGQVEPVTDEQPIYMIGAFTDNQLHLSRVDSIVQLRPQFHHVDAVVEQERSSAKGQRELANPPRPQEARAVQMAVKSVDGEDFDMTQTMKTLKEIQEEKWRRMDYADENSNEAWEGYNRLFVRAPDRVPDLQSAMSNAQYLDAISAPKVEVTAAGKRAPLHENETRLAASTLANAEVILDDVAEDDEA